MASILRVSHTYYKQQQIYEKRGNNLSILHKANVQVYR